MSSLQMSCHLDSHMVSTVGFSIHVSWLRKYPWLLYSVKLDGIFSGPCLLLLSSEKHKDKGQFVNKPFSNWIKLSSALYHHVCLELAEALRGSILNPASRVDVMKNNALQLTINKNKHYLGNLYKLFCF